MSVFTKRSTVLSSFSPLEITIHQLVAAVHRRNERKVRRTKFRPYGGNAEMSPFASSPSTIRKSALYSYVRLHNNHCMHECFNKISYDISRSTTLMTLALALSFISHLPRRYASAGNSDRNVSVRLSVRLSVRPSDRPSRAGIVKTKKASGMISSPSGSPKTLVF